MHCSLRSVFQLGIERLLIGISDHLHVLDRYHVMAGNMVFGEVVSYQLGC